MIDERLDLDLVREVAAARPDWHFVFVGPVTKIDPDSLPRADNIHYLGGRAYHELPEYLSGWDVALLPFAHNDSTRFISPTKTPEYLAAGRQVVSTSVRDVVRMFGDSGFVEIADGAVDFIAAIETCLTRMTHSGSTGGSLPGNAVVGSHVGTHAGADVTLAVRRNGARACHARAYQAVVHARTRVIGTVQAPISVMEIWGGIECTVNRVRDRYFDQVIRTGHDARPDDLARFADLGIRAIRYPILWERIAAARPLDAGLRGPTSDWRQLDALGVRPIAGLLHHGSGPRHTDLARSGVPAAVRRVRADRGGAVPVDHRVDADQRAADDRALQWLVRPLVPARAKRCGIRPDGGEPGARYRRSDGGHPRGDPGRAVPPHRRRRHGLRDRATRRQAEFENHRRDLALDLLFGRVDRQPPAVELPDRERRDAR